MGTRAKQAELPEGYPLLEVLADRALNHGDEEALAAVASLIISDDKNRSFILKGLIGYQGARAPTAQDALQAALIVFMERARKGEYKGISRDVRVIVARIAKDAVRGEKREGRKDPLYAPKATLGGVKHKLKDSSQKPPDAILMSSERGTLARAIETLDTRVQKVIQLRKEGERYTQIGRALGIDPRHAQKYVERCVASIIAAVAKRNPTKAQELARKLHKNTKPFTPPNPDDVRTFVYEEMAEEPRELVVGIHYEGKALEEFCETLGRRIAKVRLKAGYSHLKSHFGVPFPDAFEAMKS